MRTGSVAMAASHLRGAARHSSTDGPPDEHLHVTTLGELLPAAARRFAARTALVVEGESFTFAELESLSSRVAHGLVSLGVQAGDRVTLYGPNCWEWIVGYYAIAKAGAVVNPISSMLTPDEVQYVVRDSGAQVLLTSVDKGDHSPGSGRVRRAVATGDGGATPPRLVRRRSRRGSKRRRATSPLCPAGPLTWARSVTPRARRATPRVRCRATAPSSPPPRGRS